MPMVALDLTMNKQGLEDAANNEFLKEALKGKITAPEYDKIFGDISDVIKLSNAYNTFQERWEQYMKDPLAQKKNRDRIDQEKKKENDDLEETRSRTKINDAQRQQLINSSVEELQSMSESLKNSTKERDKKKQELIDDVLNTKRIHDEISHAIS